MARNRLFSQLARAMRIARFCDVQRISTAEGLERAAAGEYARGQRLNRRRFIGGVGVMAGGAALGGLMTRHAQGRRGSPARIAIVGGGLAGLICADSLQLRGVSAAIYEGNGRLGGRCHSIRNLFPGQVAEAGGELIDNLGTTMLGYAREFGLELEDLGKAPGEKYYYVGGQHHAEAEVIDEYRELVPLMRPDLRALSHQPDFFSHTPADVALDSTDLASYLGARAAGLPLIRAVLGQAYVGEYGRELHEQSCLNLLLFIHLDRRSKLAEFGVFSDERYHIVGGNDQIVSGIAARLPGPIRLGHFLTRLSRLASGEYLLEFNGQPSARADAVVLAIPFSVLRGVTLDASLDLSGDKRRAIDELGYGHNAKTMVGFSGRPWFDLYGGDGSGYSDLPNVQNTWETNYTRAGATSILTDFAGGARAESLQAVRPPRFCGECHGSLTPPFNIDPSRIQTEVDAFLTDLDRIYPGAKAAASRDASGRYIAYLGHWLPQPFSRGSYTCYLPGQFTTIAGLEGQSSDLLKFAGEHTNSFYEWQGFMEGAALSGLTAASEILRDMRAGRL